MSILAACSKFSNILHNLRIIRWLEHCHFRLYLINTINSQQNENIEPTSLPILYYYTYLCPFFSSPQNRTVSFFTQMINNSCPPSHASPGVRRTYLATLPSSTQIILLYS